MTRPANPKHVEIVSFVVAIMVMCFDGAFYLAFGAICRPCQLSSFNSIKNSIARASKHSGMFFVFLTPSIIHEHFTFSNLVKVDELAFLK